MLIHTKVAQLRSAGDVIAATCPKHPGETHLETRMPLSMDKLIRRVTTLLTNKRKSGDTSATSEKS
jgi:hypothetical protein